MLQPVRAAAFLVTHTAFALLIIVGIYAVQRGIAYLWGSDDPRLLDIVPLRYFFDLVDIGVLIIWGYRGLVAAYRAFQD